MFKGEGGAFPMELKKGIPLRTALYNEHLKLNARMTNFHGWEMPLEYTKIVEEHMAVRRNVGIFDVSHMGDVIIEGNDANKFVDYIFPTKISDLNIGECTYTAFLDTDGKMIDDTIIYKLWDDKYFLIPNAANIERIINWLNKNSTGYSIKIINHSDEISHIAVQGPKTPEVLGEMKIEMPENFHFLLNNIQFLNPLLNENFMMVSGTGYTGERGVELIIPNEIAPSLWEKLLDIIKNYDGRPCGLGARDTLRMEKGMLLSGQDFNEDKTPYEASVSFIVNLNHEFIGREKLIENKNNFKIIFRGFILENKNIPRPGFKIYHNDDEIGYITSGSVSPILNTGIGLGYINKDFMKSNEPVYIKIRDKYVKAQISKPKLF